MAKGQIKLRLQNFRYEHINMQENPPNVNFNKNVSP